MVHPTSLAALREVVARLGGQGASGGGEPFRLGLPPLDTALGGGLSRGALHEVYARRASDAAAATGFGLCLALRAAGGRGLVWARQEFVDVEAGMLHGDGVAAFGADPDKVLLVRPRDAAGVLRAANEAVRCPVLGAVLLDVWGEAKNLDLKASRRLGLAAAASGVTLVLIRSGAEPVPSAAASRWRVAAMASTPLEANAPGRPAFDANLLRHRAGLPPRAFRLEWNRDSLSFAVAPLSRSVVPVPADRPTAPAEGKARRRLG